MLNDNPVERAQKKTMTYNKLRRKRDEEWMMRSLDECFKLSYAVKLLFRNSAT